MSIVLELVRGSTLTVEPRDIDLARRDSEQGDVHKISMIDDAVGIASFDKGISSSRPRAFFENDLEFFLNEITSYRFSKCFDCLCIMTRFPNMFSNVGVSSMGHCRDIFAGKAGFEPRLHLSGEMNQPVQGSYRDQT
jgi:hypothetical protein